MNEVLCIIALGGNIGNSEAVFRRAAEMLASNGFRIRKTSSVYRTEPVDCPPGTPQFQNAAVSGYWSGMPQELLTLCQKIEAENGRPNQHGYHTSRTIDLDIILFGDQVIDTPELKIPHPEAKNRDFVKIPIREIEPEAEKLLYQLTSTNTEQPK